jgi:hypothetical protein
LWYLAYGVIRTWTAVPVTAAAIAVDVGAIGVAVRPHGPGLIGTAGSDETDICRN